MWPQLPSAAAGLSVVSLLHDQHVLQQPRPHRLIHRQVQRHLFEHRAHWHLSQIRGPQSDSPASPAHIRHNDVLTSWKWSFLNMAMLTWLSRPIFTWNFLTPSLVTPNGRKQSERHSFRGLFWNAWVVSELYYISTCKFDFFFYILRKPLLYESRLGLYVKQKNQFRIYFFGENSHFSSIFLSQIYLYIRILIYFVF